jgi:hypothetical protein
MKKYKPWRFSQNFSFWRDTQTLSSNFRFRGKNGPQQFVALRALNPKKSPIRRFFTLQTTKAARLSWFFQHKVPKKPTSATGCQAAFSKAFHKTTLEPKVRLLGKAPCSAIMPASDQDNSASRAAGSFLKILPLGRKDNNKSGRGFIYDKGKNL